MNIEELRNRPNWGRLTEVERKILEMRYNPQHRATIEEVGYRLEMRGKRGMRDLVRQMEQRALDKLAMDD